MNQIEALKILESGNNVFLTGEAGTGKSYTISQFVKQLRSKGRRYAITATTGIAASHIGGTTIHSWSGIGIKRRLTASQISFIKNNKWLSDKIRDTKVLIIDEISMYDAVSLNDLDEVLRAIVNKSKPFGGLQVVFVGDFFQLPPVVSDRKADEEVRFAFEADSWKSADLKICYLTDQYRQEDTTMLDILSAMRKEGMQEMHLKTLKDCKLPVLPKTQLFTHNAEVDQINNMELNKLDGKEEVFEMSSGGMEKLIEVLKKQCISPETLRLKVGAVVMFTRNNFDQGYVNGTTGVVKEFTKGGYPVIITTAGKEITPDHAEWKIEDKRGTQAWIKQIPLKLAWAITVHKSQGMSLDTAAIDLSKVFEFGQGYVAVSRLKSLKGLHLEGVSEEVFRMHPKVLEQDKIFRSLGEEGYEVEEAEEQEDYEIEALPF